MRQRSQRGRGPSRWYRAGEALLEACAGVSALFTLHQAITHWHPAFGIARAALHATPWAALTLALWWAGSAQEGSALERERNVTADKCAPQPTRDNTVHTDDDRGGFARTLAPSRTHAQGGLLVLAIER